MSPELIKALEDLFCYDAGISDRGINDDGFALRELCIEQIREISAEEMSRTIREMFLSESALDEDWTAEHVKDFVDWLRWRMGYTFDQVATFAKECFQVPCPPLETVHLRITAEPLSR